MDYFYKGQLLLRLIRQIINTTVWLVGKVWQAEILSGIWASGERGPCMIRGVPSKDHLDTKIQRRHTCVRNAKENGQPA